MPNHVTNDNLGIIEEYEEEDTFCKDDFGFIIGPDGELKSIMYPAHLMDDPPEEIMMILQMFGIDDFQTLETRTLH
jgi:hypothetical protein